VHGHFEHWYPTLRGHAFGIEGRKAQVPAVSLGKALEHTPVAYQDGFDCAANGGMSQCFQRHFRTNASRVPHAHRDTNAGSVR
jgi:hypothetical protein